MGYLHPDKRVSVERVLVRNKVRKRKPRPKPDTGSMVERLAIQLQSRRKTRSGY